MRLLTKEFYTLPELQSVWEIADHDVQYLVLTGDLKLTIMVHGLHLTSRLPGWGYIRRLGVQLGLSAHRVCR